MYLIYSIAPMLATPTANDISKAIMVACAILLHFPELLSVSRYTTFRLFMIPPFLPTDWEI